MNRLAIRRLAQSRPLWRPTRAIQHKLSNARSASTIVELSFWKSLIPKPLRRENRQPSGPSKTKTSWLSKEWNPATFFIVIFLLIGSMSIQMISLRQNFEAFMRRSDVRIGLLREVVERIQNGEQVDVEAVLGAGDPEREAGWEDVLREIENDSALRKEKEKKQQQEKSKTADAPPTNTKAISTSEVPRGGTAQFF